jgi:dihydroxyacetone kinase-like protein
VEELTGAILKDLQPARGQEVLLHVNGLGGTPLMELYLLFHEPARPCGAPGSSPCDRWSATTPRRWKWPAPR